MWFKKKKYPYEFKELQKMYSHLPEFIVKFIYESFYMGAMVSLSYVGTDEFTEIFETYSAFLTKLEEVQSRTDAETSEIRDTLLRNELQSILSQMDKPN